MTEKTYDVQDKLNTPVEEAYRTLRTNIQFCGIDQKIKTVTLTSTNPGEGKTTTSINLAISMAKAGLRTLLVDADLRKPMVAKRLGCNNALGLTNFISGGSALDDVISNTNIPDLYFIACGPKPPNPAELLGSASFREFVNTVREMFDLVIFDTPPLGSVIDCALISVLTDGTIFVIQSKKIDFRNAQRVKEQLEKVNARVLGVVLNKVEKNDYKNYYNYYYNYYGSKKEPQTGWFGKFRKLRTVQWLMGCRGQ